MQPGSTRRVCLRLGSARPSRMRLGGSRTASTPPAGLRMVNGRRPAGSRLRSGRSMSWPISTRTASSRRHSSRRHSRCLVSRRGTTRPDCKRRTGRARTVNTRRSNMSCSTRRRGRGRTRSGWISIRPVVRWWGVSTRSSRRLRTSTRLGARRLGGRVRVRAHRNRSRRGRRLRVGLRKSVRRRLPRRRSVRLAGSGRLCFGPRRIGLSRGTPTCRPARWRLTRYSRLPRLVATRSASPKDRGKPANLRSLILKCRPSRWARLSFPRPDGRKTDSRAPRRRTHRGRNSREPTRIDPRIRG